MRAGMIGSRRRGPAAEDPAWSSAVLAVERNLTVLTCTLTLSRTTHLRSDANDGCTE
jgi:hypothetical protein